MFSIKSRFDIKLSQGIFQWWYTGKILQVRNLELNFYVFSMKDRSYKK